MDRGLPVHSSGGLHRAPKLLLLLSLIRDAIIDQKRAYLKPEKELTELSCGLYPKKRLHWTERFQLGLNLWEGKHRIKLGFVCWDIFQMLFTIIGHVFTIGYVSRLHDRINGLIWQLSGEQLTLRTIVTVWKGIRICLQGRCLWLVAFPKLESREWGESTKRMSECLV